VTLALRCTATAKSHFCTRGRQTTFKSLSRRLSAESGRSRHEPTAGFDQAAASPPARHRPPVAPRRPRCWRSNIAAARAVSGLARREGSLCRNAGIHPTDLDQWAELRPTQITAHDLLTRASVSSASSEYNPLLFGFLRQVCTQISATPRPADDRPSVPLAHTGRRILGDAR
jgi:hypothetical protein